MGAPVRPPACAGGQVVARLRRDAYLALERGRYRQAALHYLQAQRTARRMGLPQPPWSGLAWAYRALWQQTGDERYLRRYLRYTRERVDAAQIGVGRRALGRLRLRARIARSL